MIKFFKVLQPDPVSDSFPRIFTLIKKLNVFVDTLEHYLGGLVKIFLHLKLLTIFLVNNIVQLGRTSIFIRNQVLALGRTRKLRLLKLLLR